jgi:glycosyltransferase involved in cell wall biosynthesis
VFVGSMDWYPNEDAALHLMDTILPSIRREIPGASLHIVGRNPSARVRTAAARADVEVTGTVDDVRPHVAKAAVLLVPMRVGGGTRLKIFEALAMAKAVVSTTVGAEGLPLLPGTHFLQADDPSEFAAAVVTLLRDPRRREVLGAAGRTLVAERYSWSQIASEFAAHCTEALAAPGGPVRRPPSPGNRIAR